MIQTFASWGILILHHHPQWTLMCQNYLNQNSVLLMCTRDKRVRFCFTGDVRKNKKRQKFEKISDVELFKNGASKWQEVDHSYKDVYHTVDWSSKDDKYAHKGCKSEFFDNRSLKRQIRLPTGERPMEID